MYKRGLKKLGFDNQFEPERAFVGFARNQKRESVHVRSGHGSRTAERRGDRSHRRRVDAAAERDSYRPVDAHSGGDRPRS